VQSEMADGRDTGVYMVETRQLRVHSAIRRYTHKRRIRRNPASHHFPGALDNGGKFDGAGFTSECGNEIDFCIKMYRYSEQRRARLDKKLASVDVHLE